MRAALVLMMVLAAPAAAEPYRALGTEPFWSLAIDGRRLIWSEANNGGAPRTETGARRWREGRTRLWRTRAITARVTPGRCSDGMSDRIFPDRVSVRVDGRRFEGCGGVPVGRQP